MLSSITPLGERGRNNRFWVTATVYVVATVIGGALTGAVSGGLGALFRVAVEPSAVAVGIAVLLLCAVGAAFDLHLFGLQLPSWHRQVNEDWLSIYRGWVYAAGFGFQLGMAFMTIVPSAAIYLTFALAFLSGHLLNALIIGATFGLARGLMLLTAARVEDPQALRTFHRRLQETGRFAHGAVVGAQAVVGALAMILLAELV